MMSIGTSAMVGREICRDDSRFYILTKSFLIFLDREYVYCTCLDLERCST